MRINIFSILAFFCVITLIGISGSAAFTQDVNVALKKNNPKVTAKQSSQNVWGNHPTGAKVGGPATKAIDGEKEGILTLDNAKIVETKDTNAWFEVDLGDYYKINKIVIYPRTDDCCKDGFKPVLIITDHSIGEKPIVEESKIAYSSNYSRYFDSPIKTVNTVDDIGKIGRYIRLQILGGERSS